MNTPVRRLLYFFSFDELMKVWTGVVGTVEGRTNLRDIFKEAMTGLDRLGVGNKGKTAIGSLAWESRMTAELGREIRFFNWPCKTTASRSHFGAAHRMFPG